MARRLLLATALLLALCCGSTQAAQPEQKTLNASEGVVTATLTYAQGKDRFGDATFAHEQLKITRSGVGFYEAPVGSRYCHGECPLETFGNGPLLVSDLEVNGQPDAVVHLYTGGAHCCTIVQVFSFDPGAMVYRLVERDFGDPGVRLTDVAGDGRSEFESADDRFAYEFTSFAFSGLPVQIWRFSEGRFIDVTREFPAAVAADAKRQLSQFRANRRQGLGLGFIAAWTADEDLLGRSAAAAGTLSREAHLHHLRSGDRLSPSGTAFIKKLQRFLKKTGYR